SGGGAFGISRRDESLGRRYVPVVPARHRGRSRRCGREAGGPREAMMLNRIFTPANELTLTRMLLIPGFAILLIYGYRGWALLTFAAAGLTDLLDGLIARKTGGNTVLGAWLDPMADKLMLLTMFVMLTLPEIGG